MWVSFSLLLGFLRQCLTVYSRLAWNSISSPCWPQSSEFCLSLSSVRVAGCTPYLAVTRVYEAFSRQLGVEHVSQWQERRSVLGSQATYGSPQTGCMRVSMHGSRSPVAEVCRVHKARDPEGMIYDVMMVVVSRH